MPPIILNKNDKIELEKRLASLIGFDEISDLFDHATTFATEEDLIEYMSSLLGQAGDNVQRFCADVTKYKLGQPISRLTSSTTASSSNVVSALRAPLDYSGKSKSNSNHKKNMTSTKNNNNNNRRNIKSKGKDSKGRTLSKREQMQQRKKNNNTNKAEINQNINLKSPPEPLTMDDVASSLSNINSSNSSHQNDIEQSKHQETICKPASKPDPEPKPLARGEAKFVCGCWGTIHEPLINCLYCGRISCKREGFGFCPGCGYEIESIDSSIRSAVADKRYDSNFILNIIVDIFSVFIHHFICHLNTF